MYIGYNYMYMCVLEILKTNMINIILKDFHPIFYKKNIYRNL